MCSAPIIPQPGGDLTSWPRKPGGLSDKTGRACVLKVMCVSPVNEPDEVSNHFCGVCVCGSWERHRWFPCINRSWPFRFSYCHLSAIFVLFSCFSLFLFSDIFFFILPFHLCLSLLFFQLFVFQQMTSFLSLSPIYFFLLCLGLISNPGSLGSVDWLSSCSTPLCHPGWLAFIMDKGGLHTNTHAPLYPTEDPLHYPSPLYGFYLHLWPSSISIPFFCYQFPSIHLSLF